MNQPADLLPGLQQSVMLAPYTTFKIGGPADWFLEVNDLQELIRAIGFARRQKIPYFFLGSGSNILVSDAGFRGLAIRYLADEIKVSDAEIYVEAGRLLRQLVDSALQNSLTGLEFAVGIPGSVGGGVRGNAGAWQQSLGDKIIRVQILDNQGRKIWLSQKECHFGYRQSRFKKTGEMIFAAELRLEKGDQEQIRQLMAENLAKRASQPKQPSAGCVFINPAKSRCGGTAGQVPRSCSAGELIEKCGLKGRQIGQAQISPEHANFIINLGNAKANDVLALIKLAKKAVFEKFNLDLKLEMQLVGSDDV